MGKKARPAPAILLINLQAKNQSADAIPALSVGVRRQGAQGCWHREVQNPDVALAGGHEVLERY